MRKKKIKLMVHVGDTILGNVKGGVDLFLDLKRKTV
jgi:hypothetical protein